MEIVKMKKKLLIEVDIIDGSCTYTNLDNMSYMEAMGAIEFAKMCMYKEMMDGEVRK